MNQATKLIRTLLLSGLALLWSLTASAVTVSASPGTCTSSAIGLLAWTNPTNARTSNTTYATATATSATGLQLTDNLTCNNYGFAIPAGSTINGVQVNIRRKISSTNSTTGQDSGVYLINSSGAINAGTNRATATAYTTSDVVDVHGTATDLWGAAWTVTDINSTNFGAAYQGSISKTTSSTTRTISVDYIQITIDYTAPPTVTSINRASANPTAPATAVAWTVVFSTSMTGVDSSDFLLVQSGGVSGATITSVTGSGATWTVNANTGSGAGTLGVNLIDDDTIIDGSSVPLGGSGVGNGNFTGQIYTVAGPSVVSINRASANPTAPATAIAWTVVFDRSVTGVDVSDFALAITGSISGASITSVTGSGTTWTVNANTGAYGGTIGLNLVDDDTIIDSSGAKLGGTGAANGNFTGQVYTDTPPFCSPPSNTPAGLTVTCVCDNFGRAALNPSTIFGGTWALSNSDGIANAYINATTGFLRLTENTASNAKAATVPSIFPAAGNYISVEFNHYAYNGSGADGIALTLSDYSIPAVAGGFGGSLGYAQRNDGVLPPGFAGGWIGIALDEYGNFQNPTEGRVLGPGARVQSIGVRGPGSGANGYRYMGGTTSSPGGLTIDNRTSTTPAPGYMYQVIVDARASSSNTINVNVNRDSTTKDGTNYSSLFGPFNAHTEAAYALSQGWTTKILPDFWKISFTGSTGASTNIHEIGGLRICAQSIAPATGGTASGFSAIDEAYPAAAGSTIPAYPNFSTGDIYMKLAGTPFKLWVAALSGTGISTAYSAVSNKYLQVKLVDNTDNACGPMTARTCNAACTGKAAVEAGGTQVMTMATGSSVPPRDPGAKLSSNFTLNSAYQNLIAVIKECVDVTCGSFTATAPACSADSFSVRPLSVTSVTSVETPAGAGNAATQLGISGSPTFKAGSGAFALTAATGVTGYSGVLKINNSTVQAVAPGTHAGTITPALFPAAATATGSATGTAFTYDEVGVFTLPGYVPSVTGTAGNDASPRGVYDGVQTATECAGLTSIQCDTSFRQATWTGIDSISTKGDCILDSYSNVKVGGKYGCNFGNTSSLSFGRFIPDHFAISGNTLRNRAEIGTCADTFTYFGEQINLVFTLTAQASGGATTQNYVGTRAKLDPSVFANLQMGAVDRTTVLTPAPPYLLTPRISTTGMPAVSCATSPCFPNSGALGVAATVTVPFMFTRAASPEGPYGFVDIGIRPTDSDGVTVPLDIDTSTATNPAVTMNRGKVGQTILRYGRLLIPNMYGSELLDLPIDVVAQVWNGTSYATNVLDACTPIATANFTKTAVAGGGTITTTLSGGGTIAGGTGKITLSKPSGFTSKGSVDIASAIGYLPGIGRETFGIYKAGPVIYIREVY
jgi:MSHA biogenesis protein MshQ